MVLAAVCIAASVWGWLAARGSFGVRYDGGQNLDRALDGRVIADRSLRVADAARSVGAPEGKQILFGDLHAHTTFSFDAFSISLPMYQGEGAHPPADACDFARFCAELDFWSINDHAESLTPYQWAETKRVVRQCNAVSGDPANPDMVTFLGWEWTQIGDRPENHYGHKNVVFLATAEDLVPTRPIASRDRLFPGPNPYGTVMRLALIAGAPGGRGRQPYHDLARLLEDRGAVPPCRQGVAVRDNPTDCQESAATPAELFAKLDDWGFPYLVIPHGNTWGAYTPPRSNWDKQLAARHRLERESLIEVFSGHGNIEQYRPWRAVEIDDQGVVRCPQPSPGYTPECWRAGEIIRGRCLETGEGENECERRSAVARARHVAAGQAGHLTVPGSMVEDWLDAGQCRDCYMPAYNYRPGGSVQYALVRRDSARAPRRRFRFGMLGSSDVHTARPGTGYKEYQRLRMSDTRLANIGPPKELNQRESLPESIPVEEVRFATAYFERFASFLGTGGLAAVHSAGRDRRSIWQALQRKEVYATSGDRILLWFDLVDGKERSPMGSTVRRTHAPRFEVRVLGAFEQLSGCRSETRAVLSAERLERLCGGECYHPGSERKRIERIEVIRLLPQLTDEEQIDALIEDPWRVFPCNDDGGGCVVDFTDPSFDTLGRDVVYYVRAIQAPSPTVNGGNLRCVARGGDPCVAVDPCHAGAPTDAGDECTTVVSERAWSSPIFVDFG